MRASWAAVIVVIAFARVGPLAATSTVTTDQGASHTGRIEQPEIPMVEATGGRLALLRPSVQRLERTESGEILATLKDRAAVFWWYTWRFRL